MIGHINGTQRGNTMEWEYYILSETRGQIPERHHRDFKFSNMMRWIAVAFIIYGCTSAAFSLRDVSAATIPDPPQPEPIQVIELPLPPVAPSNDMGSCTPDINPHRTGCILQGLGDYEFQAGDFSPDGLHVIVNVKFVGAPEVPDLAAIYDGEQLILVKTDGTTFKNGDTWKCLSCGVTEKQMIAIDPQRDYPHVFRSGDKALWGHK